MVWDDPDFLKYYNGLVNDTVGEGTQASNQALQRFRVESTRANMVSGVHFASMLAEYGSAAVHRPALGMLRSFETTCEKLRLSPGNNDYSELSERIRAFVRTATDAAQARLSEEFRKSESLVGLVRNIRQIENQAIRDVTKQIERRKLEIKRQSPPTGVFISHIGRDAAIASRLKTLLRKTIGDDISV